MIIGFPTAAPACGLKGPPATVTVEKSRHPSHTEILTLPIDTESTIALFEQLLPTYAAATYLYVICDNARYYRSRAVQAFLEGSRIQLIFLPAYAPNLNVIERLWHFFKDSPLQPILRNVRPIPNGVRKFLSPFPAILERITLVADREL